MDNSLYKVLSVKLTADVDEEKSSIIVVIKSVKDGEVISRTITPDMDNYETLMKLIVEDFQQGKITQEEFSSQLLALVVSTDIIGINDTIGKSKTLSAHVVLADNAIYVDGVEVNNLLEREILELMKSIDEGTEPDESWLSLIHFVEKLYKNTSERVRNQLYGWMNYQINHGSLTLTTEGNLITYKGGNVGTDSNGDTTIYSVHCGHGFVNGQEYKDAYLPNRKGDIVEIPRDEVDDDPNSACSTGLHVGTWDYASSFADSTMTVEIDPADVVSVPSDYNNQKVRVCRYKVIDVVKEQLDKAIFTAEEEEDEEVEDNYNEVIIPEGFSAIPAVQAGRDYVDVPENWDAILYTTKDGEQRIYDDYSIKDCDKTHLYLKNKDGEYRTLIAKNTAFLFENSSWNPDESATAKTPDSVLNTDKINIEPIPEDWNIIIYKTVDNNAREYRNATIEKYDDTHILILTEDGQYRSLLRKNVVFRNEANLKNSDGWETVNFDN